MLPILVAESQAIAENEANQPQYEGSRREIGVGTGTAPTTPQTNRGMPSFHTHPNHHRLFEASQASTNYSYDSRSDVSSVEEGQVFCTSSHPKINLFLYVATYIAFMAFGACIFSLIEQPLELRIREQLVHKQNEFLAKHPCVDRAALDELLEFVSMAKERGMTIKQLDKLSERALPSGVSAGAMLDKFANAQTAGQVFNQLTRKLQSTEFSVGGQEQPNPSESHPTAKPHKRSTGSSKPRPSEHQENSGPQMKVNFPMRDDRLQWEFTSSLMYVTSIMTTIGYGHVTPATQLGKIFTIIYSSIGIPATLTLMSAFVALIIRGPVNWFEAQLYRFMTAIRRFRFVSLFTLRIIHLIIITAVLLSICFFIPALIFVHFEEGWTYLDALYCCFISLTTIGLGDFVPSLTLEHAGYYELAAYRIGTISYLYFGLIMIMLWLALIYRIPQLNFEKLLLPKDCESDPSKMGTPAWSSPPPSTTGSSKQNSTEKSRILTRSSLTSDYSSMMPSPRGSITPSCGGSSITSSQSVSSRSSSFASMVNMVPASSSTAAGALAAANTAKAASRPPRIEICLANGNNNQFTQSS